VRSISAENQAALDAGTLVARDFVWFVVRNRDTGADVTDGYWSDVGTITASVINPDTLASEGRTWKGAAELIQISDIPAVSTLTVQQVTITLSQVSDQINTLVRAYDCKQGRVEIYRGLFNPSTRTMVAPAESSFVGFIDEAPITTPKENEGGDVTLTCTSHTQEMTRSNSDTRSDASQRLRSATDNFYQDTAVVSTWQQSWGRAGGPVRTSGSRGGGLPGLFGSALG
jgi:hypothetical protein